jgi:hypothetical protein
LLLPPPQKICGFAKCPGLACNRLMRRHFPATPPALSRIFANSRIAGTVPGRRRG